LLPAKKKSLPSRENFSPLVVTKPAGTASAGAQAKAAAMMEANFILTIESYAVEMVLIPTIYSVSLQHL
jgi:hypothetical protein